MTCKTFETIWVTRFPVFSGKNNRYGEIIFREIKISEIEIRTFIKLEKWEFGHLSNWRNENSGQQN